MDVLKSLNIDPVVMLCNGLLFLFLLIVLDRLFWKPIIAHLDERRKNIAGAYENIDATRAELDRLAREYQDRVARIESEARSHIQQTVRAAQTQREQVLAEAHASAEEIMKQGAVEIEADHDAAVTAMQDRLSAVAMELVAKVTGETPGPERTRLAEEYIAQRATRS